VTPTSARQLAAEANAHDSELMARVRDRDLPALGALYDRHAAVVHGLGLRILADPAEAADLVQDVFLHLWRRAELFDGERGQFTGWLVSLARNRAIDRLRARRARHIPPPGGEAAAPGGPPGPVAEESAYVTELRATVARALALLPEVQRAALEQAYFGGSSHAEIAERLASPVEAVKGRIRQGMIRLRDLLGEFADAAVMTEAEAEE
jgi:RNA polymerase sigma-70 factor, ECF subfamily